MNRRSWLGLAGSAALAGAGRPCQGDTDTVVIPGLPPDFIPWRMQLSRRRDGRKIEAVIRKVRGHQIDARAHGRAYQIDAWQLESTSRARIDFLQIRGQARPLDLQEDRAAEIKEAGLKAFTYVRPESEVELPFCLYQPPGAGERGDNLPLLMFLHGNGGRGTDGYMNYADANKAPLHFIDEAFQRWLPCYVFIPQSNAENSLWSNPSFFRPREFLLRAVQCIDVLKARYGLAIDMKRLYVTGLSSGGNGCYEAIAKFPGKFAAAVPIACDHEPVLFYRANATPLWYFANENDPTIYFPRVHEMAAHFKALGSEHRITLLSGRGHNAWNEAYGNLDFRNWLGRRELRQELYPTDYRTWIDEEDQEREDREALGQSNKPTTHGSLA